MFLFQTSLSLFSDFLPLALFLSFLLSDFGHFVLVLCSLFFYVCILYVFSILSLFHILYLFHIFLYLQYLDIGVVNALRRAADAECSSSSLPLIYFISYSLLSHCHSLFFPSLSLSPLFLQSA